MGNMQISDLVHCLVRIVIATWQEGYCVSLIPSDIVHEQDHRGSLALERAINSRSRRLTRSLLSPKYDLGLIFQTCKHWPRRCSADLARIGPSRDATSAKLPPVRLFRLGQNITHHGAIQDCVRRAGTIGKTVVLQVDRMSGATLHHPPSLPLIIIIVRTCGVCVRACVSGKLGSEVSEPGCQRKTRCISQGDWSRRSETCLGVKCLVEDWLG